MTAREDSFVEQQAVVARTKRVAFVAEQKELASLVEQADLETLVAEASLVELKKNPTDLSESEDSSVEFRQ